MTTAFTLQPAHELLASSPSCARAQTPPSAGCSALIQHPLRSLGLTRLTPRGERRIRALYGALLMRAARLLDLPIMAGMTAVTYWMRFYARESLLQYHPQLCAAAALVLASKVEECSRRVRDVINVVYRCEHSAPHAPLQQQPVAHTPSHPSTQLPPYSSYASPLHPSSSSSSAALSNITLAAPPPLHPSSATAPAAHSTAAAASLYPPPAALDGSSLQVSPLFWDLKEEVLRFEQKLLRVLAFHCRIVHPQQYVLHIAREIEASEELCRMAFYMANDTARTTLCLQYAPHAIACACIYLAAEMSQEQIRFHPIVIQSSNSTGGSNSNDQRKSAASPYRSPHHSNTAASGAASSVSSAAGVAASAASSSSSSSSLLVTSTSSHGSEWWEYFGGVNQLEIEDITHQLLDLLEDADGEGEDASIGGPGGGGGGGGGRTPSQELERIAEDVLRELKQEAAKDAARNQRIEASVREAAASAPIEDERTTVAAVPPPHARGALPRHPYSASSSANVSSNSDAYPSYSAAAFAPAVLAGVAGRTLSSSTGRLLQFAPPAPPAPPAAAGTTNGRSLLLRRP